MAENWPKIGREDYDEVRRFIISRDEFEAAGAIRGCLGKRVLPRCEKLLPRVPPRAPSDIEKKRQVKKFKARSRLYQGELWQVNVRFAAFFKHCKICALLHRSEFRNVLFNKKYFVKPAILVNYQQNFQNLPDVAKMNFCQICEKSAR